MRAGQPVVTQASSGRALRCKEALLATVHNPNFTTLSIVKSDDRVRLAVLDIKDEKFWQANYVLLRSVFPALRTLRYCDSNTPAMDKLYYLTHRVTRALHNSAQMLDDTTLFSEIEDDEGVAFEREQVYGTDEEPEIPEPDEEEPEIPEPDEDLSDGDSNAGSGSIGLGGLREFARRLYRLCKTP